MNENKSFMIIGILLFVLLLSLVFLVKIDSVKSEQQVIYDSITPAEQETKMCIANPLIKILKPEIAKEIIRKNEWIRGYDGK